MIYRELTVISTTMRNSMMSASSVFAIGYVTIITKLLKTLKVTPGIECSKAKIQHF